MSTEHDDDRSTASGISRRSVLAAGAIGIPGVALVACSQAKAPAKEPATGSSSAAGTGSAASTGSAAPTSPASGSGGPPLAKLSDIKVGEAVSAKGADGKPIIIARPTATTVAAFTAICTHQGCTVAPAGKELDCPCHGSVYNATTGAVINGPAQRPLSAVKVTLSGDDVVAG
jgi:cytochrome b6-f complex iron-sulfur subunit